MEIRKFIKYWRLIVGVLCFILGGKLLYGTKNIPLVYLFSILTSVFLIKETYNKIFINADKEMVKKGEDEELKDEYGYIITYEGKFKTRSSITPTWLGALEQLLYITTIISGNAPFIAIWLGLKIAGIWKVWEQSNDRISYNMFVIGNALSLLNAFYWSYIFNPDLLKIASQLIKNN